MRDVLGHVRKAQEFGSTLAEYASSAGVEVREVYEAAAGAQGCDRLSGKSEEAAHARQFADTHRAAPITCRLGRCNYQDSLQPAAI
jgi:hypothetical protein